MSRFIMALVLAAAVAAVPAAASPYKIDITDFTQPDDATALSVSSSPTVASFDPGGFGLNDVSTQSLSGTYLGNYFFYSASAGGGFGPYSGEQLYTGPEDAPTFRLGTFTDGSGVSVTISDKEALYDIVYVSARSSADDFRFRSLSAPTIAYGDAGGFALSGISTITPAGTTSADYFFYSATSGGGFLNVGGEQLYTGPATAPTFRLGNFSFFDGDGLVASLTISAAAVPEPATWGMMILGFGLIGGVVRRRGGVLARS